MLGDRLKKLRKDKKLTLQALADKIGTSKGYLGELENYLSKNLGAKLLYKIANILDVKMEFLIAADVKTNFDDIFLKAYKKLEPHNKKLLYKIMIALTKKDGY